MAPYKASRQGPWGPESIADRRSGSDGRASLGLARSRPIGSRVSLVAGTGGNLWQPERKVFPAILMAVWKNGRNLNIYRSGLLPLASSVKKRKRSGKRPLTAEEEALYNSSRSLPGFGRCLPAVIRLAAWQATGCATVNSHPGRSGIRMERLPKPGHPAQVAADVRGRAPPFDELTAFFTE